MLITPHLQGATRGRIEMIIPKPKNIEVDFTDAKLTPVAGSLFIANIAEQMGLPSLLENHIKLKKRKRGCDDKTSLLGLVHNFCTGNGKLSDMDALRADTTTVTLLGLDDVPSSKRMGEYLQRFDSESVNSLHEITRQLCKQIAPEIIEHCLIQQDYVSVFVDGTEIEVLGKLFEKANVGYSGNRQYWLHNIFIGGLWVSGRLNPGASDVCIGWKSQLENDIAPLIAKGQKVWARMDNAYYRKDVEAWYRAKNWDFSISVTNANNCRPVLDFIDGLPDTAWTPIRDDGTEEAIISHHHPAGWGCEQTYVVTRSWYDGCQKLTTPRHSVILVGNAELPLKEIVRRHREKQGQENAQKGPLIELDLHRPPCRDFAANQAFYACGQIAQVLLLALQYKALPTEARKHGLRPLIRDVVRTVGRLTSSSRKWKLLFAKTIFRLDWVLTATLRLTSSTSPPLFSG